MLADGWHETVFLSMGEAEGEALEVGDERGTTMDEEAGDGCPLAARRGEGRRRGGGETQCEGGSTPYSTACRARAAEGVR